MTEHTAEFDADMCECDRPDEADNPHRHTFDVACVYWIAGRPSLARRRAAAEGRRPVRVADPRHSAR
jgi:hypothetical protein